MKGRGLLFLLGWMVLLFPAGAGLVLSQPQSPARGDERHSADSVHDSKAEASFPRQPGPDWALESDQNGIRVYSRKIEGSSIREVLAETTLPAPLGRVLKAIEDYRNYPAFMPYVEESVVSEQGEGKTRLFLQLGFPPPISDRFYTIILHRASDPLDSGATMVLWDVARDDLPKKKGQGIEVTINRGGWRLQSANGAEATRVLYYVHTDPGGILPAWAINLANTVAVPKVITGLKERVSSQANQ